MTSDDVVKVYVYPAGLLDRSDEASQVNCVWGTITTLKLCVWNQNEKGKSNRDLKLVAYPKGIKNEPRITKWGSSAIKRWVKIRSNEIFHKGPQSDLIALMPNDARDFAVLWGGGWEHGYHVAEAPHYFGLARDAFFAFSNTRKRTAALAYFLIWHKEPREINERTFETRFKHKGHFLRYSDVKVKAGNDLTDSYKVRIKVVIPKNGCSKDIVRFEQSSTTDKFFEISGLPDLPPNRKGEGFFVRYIPRWSPESVREEHAFYHRNQIGPKYDDLTRLVKELKVGIDQNSEFRKQGEIVSIFRGDRSIVQITGDISSDQFKQGWVIPEIYLENLQEPRIVVRIWLLWLDWMSKGDEVPDQERVEIWLDPLSKRITKIVSDAHWREVHSDYDYDLEGIRHPVKVYISKKCPERILERNDGTLIFRIGSVSEKIAIPSKLVILFGLTLLFLGYSISLEHFKMLWEIIPLENFKMVGEILVLVGLSPLALQIPAMPRYRKKYEAFKSFLYLHTAHSVGTNIWRYSLGSKVHTPCFGDTEESPDDCREILRFTDITSSNESFKDGLQKIERYIISNLGEQKKFVPDTYLALLRQTVPSLRVRIMLVDIGGELGGFIHTEVYASLACIKMVATVEGKRGLGFGTRLVERELEALEKMKVRHVFVEIHPQNPAKKLFSGLGFEDSNSWKFFVKHKEFTNEYLRLIRTRLDLIGGNMILMIKKLE